MKRILLASLGLLLLPEVVWAAFNPNQGLGRILTIIANLLDQVVPVIVVIVLIYFFWGVVQYIRKSGEEGDREKARQTMIYGIVILFVIVSVWGLVKLVQTTFTGDAGTAPQIPGVEKNRNQLNPGSIPSGGGPRPTGG